LNSGKFSNSAERQKKTEQEGRYSKNTEEKDVSHAREKGKE